MRKKRQLRDGVMCLRGALRDANTDPERLRYGAAESTDACPRKAEAAENLFISCMDRRGTAIRDMYRRWQKFQTGIGSRQEVISCCAEHRRNQTHRITQQQNTLQKQIHRSRPKQSKLESLQGSLISETHSSVFPLWAGSVGRSSSSTLPTER